MDTRVKDWQTDQRAADNTLTAAALRRAAVRIVGAIVLVWLALFVLKRSFPYVENGAASVGAIKYELAQRPSLFSTKARFRLFTFGNSQVLAGFEPALFSKLLNDEMDVYNLAIPGEERYVDLLEAALKAGNIPTHIMIQSLPRKPESISLWDTFLDNKRMINICFPFRDYLRDLVIFSFQAKGPLGFARQYQSNTAQIEKVITDRGHYFIKSQSHYLDDALPEDYALPTDRPNEVQRPVIDTERPEFQRLIALADRYDFAIVVAPVAYRVGVYAQPGPDNPGLSQSLKGYSRVHVVGPAYYLMEPRFFSDPLHLNPGGADKYTSTLASLMRETMTGLK